MSDTEWRHLYDKENISELIFKGGYPEALSINNEKERKSWFNDYINTILENDLKVIKSRSVQEIDSINEFIKTQPISSPIKIIMIEEADRLSSQAQTELKEKYTEQYQKQLIKQ